MCKVMRDNSTVLKENSLIGSEIEIVIDGKAIKVPIGTTILEAAQKIGIKIPTLCYHQDLHPIGVCRICVVEVEGERTLQTSCTYPIVKPLKIKTFTEEIYKTRREIISLLMSEHYGDCLTCYKSTKCELQKLAKEYNIGDAKFGLEKSPKYSLDDEGIIQRDINKCILCRRCVQTCREIQSIGSLGVVGRGENSYVTTYGELPLNETFCINCGQCVLRCPTGALKTRDYIEEIWKAIDDPEKTVIIQTAPAPRAAIGEEFGLEAGTTLTWKLNTALRYCGFDKVFDTNFAADLTIIEEGTELLLRLYENIVLKKSEKRLPQFTSCSPGWIKYIEHFYPEFLSNVSTCKSPQQMFGAIIKSWYAKLNNIDPSNIVSVSLMPCSAKKFECNRPEMKASGFKDVDYALTTREVAQMIKQRGISITELPESDFDEPFGTATGSGVIFGVSGGVMESALRTVIELVTGEKVENFFENADIIPVRGFEGCRIAEIKIPPYTGKVPSLLSHLFKDWDWIKGIVLKVGIAHGISNAKKVMEDIKNNGIFSTCHFIEFMACPGGCLGGGGQPTPVDPLIRKKRSEAIYKEDHNYGEKQKPRKSHENPAILYLYEKFLIEGPCGKTSHHYLHTHYINRKERMR